MASAALGPYSRAAVLSCKANELHYRGHRERSNDKFREALAAARAVGTEDCLVTAFLIVETAGVAVSSLVRLSNERPMTPLDRGSFADKLRECAEAVAGAAAVARRRRAAGTDLAAEQAWHVEYHVTCVLATNDCSSSEARECATRLASLCSETTVYAAYQALHALKIATNMALFNAAELSSRLEVACDLRPG